MGEIVGSIKGISEAASFLSTPIVSGNVSLYNETNGKSILPTPVIGMVGAIDEVENSLEISAKLDNVLIVLDNLKILKQVGLVVVSIKKLLIKNMMERLHQ